MTRPKYETVLKSDHTARYLSPLGGITIASDGKNLFFTVDSRKNLGGITAGSQQQQLSSFAVDSNKTTGKSQLNCNWFGMMAP